MVKNGTYLYAFDGLMNIVSSKFIDRGDVNVKNLVRTANWMRSMIPVDVVIYAVDNRFGLWGDFQTAVKQGFYDFTKRVEFADMISREGLKIG